MLKLRKMFRTFLIRKLIKLTDIPSIDEFSEKDMSLINDWLLMSSGHRGFYLYLRARDRSIAQSLVNQDVDTKDGRKMYNSLSGRRLEIVRLQSRAEKEKRKKENS